MSIVDGPAPPGSGARESRSPMEATHLAFSEISIAALDSADASALDQMDFGIVGLDRSGNTARYNLLESKLAGLVRDNVVGQNFFLTTGVCMNNFLVAQRFEDEPVLDVTLDYVLTFRMRPTPVKLRLLQDPTSAFHYVLIQRSRPRP